MQQPCSNCPFRKTSAGMLHPGRAQGLLYDGGFYCHKTVDYSGDGDGDGEVTPDSKACFGAALWLEHVAPGGCRSNLFFRLALRRGDFGLVDLRRDPIVFEDLEFFVAQELA